MYKDLQVCRSLLECMPSAVVNLNKLLTYFRDLSFSLRTKKDGSQARIYNLSRSYSPERSYYFSLYGEEYLNKISSDALKFYASHLREFISIVFQTTW